MNVALNVDHPHAAQPRRRALSALGLGLCLAWASLSPVQAQAHSGHAAPGSELKRTEVQLQMPAVAVQRQDGRQVDFRRLLDDGRPVLLNFVYTSCTAICPVTAQVFRDVRERLGKDRGLVHVVSVSIDPEYDTPARLAAYGERFSDDDKWSFLTASRGDSVAIQKAFKAYQGDKMNHLPVSFVRSAPGKPWVRLDGFASPRILVAEVQDAVTAWRQGAKGAAVAANLPR